MTNRSAENKLKIISLKNDSVSKTSDLRYQKEATNKLKAILFKYLLYV